MTRSRRRSGTRSARQALEAARHKVGLDKPLIVQYWDYLWATLHLDFGTTFTDNQPVIDVVETTAARPLSLTMAAFLIALVVGIPLGLLAGRLRDTGSDVVIRIFGIITYAAPIFFVGLLAQIYVAPPLGLPTGGRGDP